jgi:broad specificity phosphatase PhoE
MQTITAARPCRSFTSFHIYGYDLIRAALQAVKWALTMSIILTLISHASTRAVRDAAFPMDEPLDPQGRAKAAALAADRRRVDVALTSPALRTRQTAEALQLDATVDPALRDIDLGRWAGLVLSEIQGTEPDAVADWISKTDAAPHGGESVVDVLERIAPWLSSLSRGAKHVVAVTHPAVIRAAVILAIDAKPASFWRIDVAPLCRVRLSGNGFRWNLQSIGS